MRGKLFKHMFLVAMSVFVACTALFMWSLYSYFTEARQSEQREETAYAAAAVEEGGKTFLQTKLPNHHPRQDRERFCERHPQAREAGECGDDHGHTGRGVCAG